MDRFSDRPEPRSSRRSFYTRYLDTKCKVTREKHFRTGFDIEEVVNLFSIVMSLNINTVCFFFFLAALNFEIEMIHSFEENVRRSIWIGKFWNSKFFNF